MASRRSLLSRNNHIVNAYEDSIPNRGFDIPLVNLDIQFIGATNFPKCDYFGSCDPYFIATLDGEVSFDSSVKQNTLSPVWNEHWCVKNVPSDAELCVKFFDKDDVKADDYIGSSIIRISGGQIDIEIVHPHPDVDKIRGVFSLEITFSRSSLSWPPEDLSQTNCLYMFDGPSRYSHKPSPYIGYLTSSYGHSQPHSTWKISLRRVRCFFEKDHVQHWNRSYEAARLIFGNGVKSEMIRMVTRQAHRMLYGCSLQSHTGVVRGAKDLMSIITGGVEYEGWMKAGCPRDIAGQGKLTSESQPDSAQNTTQAGQQRNIISRISPAIYTYVISSEDDSFRFSETGTTLCLDFASKHAVHNNCCETVWYSGDFHLRLQGGWEKFSDHIKDEEVKWELVIDNNSGTYAPSKDLLPRLKELMEENFPEFSVLAYNYDDPELKKSKVACKNYANKRARTKTVSHVLEKYQLGILGKA